jgi:uncharacterized protein YndB with AHSA1/START domain
MSPIVSTIEIDRPPEEVFAYATDPTRFAEWQHDVVRAQLVGGGTAAVGSRFTTTRRFGGVERTMTQEISQLDCPRSWAARGVDGPFRASATVTVEPLSGGARSRVTFALDFHGRGLGDLLTPVIRRMAARQAPQSYRHLKERLERDG